MAMSARNNLNWEDELYDDMDVYSPLPTRQPAEKKVKGKKAKQPQADMLELRQEDEQYESISNGIVSFNGRKGRKGKKSAKSRKTKYDLDEEDFAVDITASMELDVFR
eukprot:CAMPEP_0117661922 /NCGR_PEP_ID=MMETSP0804-20121206/7790_1 /TAXON_ID=1074897 /ORGANISM="Tetraselmis astigmatica, Strain CCMP880" /LENGTH=107 /DNA_ID=CAMNT_0005468811 /DNA_START=354 /DNA_END=677 /DNA_ORIENTATION=-